MELKSYQRTTLDQLQRYLAALSEAQRKAAQVAASNLGITYEWDREAWRTVSREPYQARVSGAGDPVPYACLRIPTGGGKTLLGVKAIDLISQEYLRRQYGLVLWIVPTSEIYRQTLRAFRDRAHPYRQLLDLSSGNRTLIIEKERAFSPADVRESLVVLLLMLPSASRENKATLRLFRDRGGFDAFFPHEERLDLHAALLREIPNLDHFASDGLGSGLIKTSLGNTLRLLRPLIVLDEGHRAYSRLAQETLFGFNPSFVIELSATPQRGRSNMLVSIDARQVQREGMIKLDMRLHFKASVHWHDTLLAAYQRRVELEDIARQYAMNGGDYIRPICLVQVEYTGAKQRKPGQIHAEDAREFLIQRCGVLPEAIAVKSAECDELVDTDLFAPECPITYIITKQALQEGWDCSFAYILAVLTNTDAAASLTQLVGRVLRQPYARKTGIADLDESYVFCFRGKAREALVAVKRGLEQEGLGDVAGHVVLEDEQAGSAATVAIQVRDQFHDQIGKVYLPCFVVPNGHGGFREVRYEIDVLSRIDWTQIDLCTFDTLQLNPSDQGDRMVRIGIDAFMEQETVTMAAVMPLDLAFLTRQIIDTVISPWDAYAIVEDALARLRLRYSDEAIRRDLSFVLSELKRIVREQRNLLAETAFRGMIERDDLKFYLVAGYAGTAVPERIVARTPARQLVDEVNAPLQRSLFEYEPEAAFNETERAVALYLDRQYWVLWWYRNVVKAGYSIQGWREHRVFGDFIVNTARPAADDDPAAMQLNTILVLETKGLYLKNEDTAYKQDLFSLCNQLSEPYPIEALAQQFSDHKVRFELVYEDEWQRIMNAMFA
jgi:type III restriction enzyme